MYDCIFFTDVTSNLVPVPTIGAYKLAHELRKQGYSCLVINHFSYFSAEELYSIVELAVSDKTSLIGFSTTFLKSIQSDGSFSDLDSSTVFPQGKEVENKFIELCKKQNPKIKTIAGGVKVNSNYSNKNIDYVCIGYSEASILQVMRHLKFGENLTSATKNVWGRIIIDDRFAPSYDFVNSNFAWLPEDVVLHKTLPLEVARGCIFKCKFCSYPMNGKQNLDFVRTEQNLFEELQRNYDQFGISQYTLVDDTFNDHEEKLQRFLRVVNRLSFRPKFWAYIRLDLISTRPHTLQLLNDIGIKAMFFGLESFNPTTAKIVGKGYSIEKQISMINNIRCNTDISMHGNFIIGLPEDTEKNIITTYDKIVSQEIPLHSWMFLPLRIDRPEFSAYSSDIEKNFVSYGYRELAVDKTINHLSSNGANFDKSINWENSQFTFKRAVSLSQQLADDARNSSTLHVDGDTAIHIASVGVNGLSYDRVRNTLVRDFNIGAFNNIIKPKFIKLYTEKLFSLLRV